MRDIKFRVWDKESKIMNRVRRLDFLGNRIKVNNDIDFVLNMNDKENQNIILMQYTGIKDINGKEIYEGDIIECSGVIELIGVIVFKDCEYCIKHKYKYRNKFDYMSLKEYDVYDDIKSSFKFKNTFKVVGNIYENKDLLEK